MFFRSKPKPPKDAASKEDVSATGHGGAHGKTQDTPVRERSWFSTKDASAPDMSPPITPHVDAPTASLDERAFKPEAASMGAAAAADGASGSEVQSKHVERSRQFAVALGQVTAVAMHSKPHQSMKLSDFRHRVVPALLSGQFALASRRDEKLGVLTPVTALLWASVSDAVDQRLSDGESGAFKLERSDWQSGPHLWVVDVFGDQAMLAGLLRQLGQSQWGGRPVKLYARDADGGRVVRTIDKF